jgi:hypothetical protein
MDSEIFVHLFHVLIVTSLFLYVGIYKTSISKYIFPVLLALGILVVLYHAFKLYKYAKEGKGYWVNLIHILLIGPLLIYIGYNAAKTERLYFELLLMIGFASVGYHGYYLVSSTKEKGEK